MPKIKTEMEKTEEWLNSPEVKDRLKKAEKRIAEEDKREQERYEKELKERSKDGQLGGIILAVIGVILVSLIWNWLFGDSLSRF